MNKCNTCKHHKDSQNRIAWSSGYKYCHSEKLIEDDYFLTREKSSDVLVYDYSESGGFQTGPDFGCVHWEWNTDIKLNDIFDANIILFYDDAGAYIREALAELLDGKILSLEGIPYTEGDVITKLKAFVAVETAGGTAEFI